MKSKKLKGIISIVGATTIIMGSLVACGDTDKKDVASTDNSTTQTQENTQSDTTNKNNSISDSKNDKESVKKDTADISAFIQKNNEQNDIKGIIDKGSNKIDNASLSNTNESKSKVERVTDKSNKDRKYVTEKVVSNKDNNKVRNVVHNDRNTIKDKPIEKPKDKPIDKPKDKPVDRPKDKPKENKAPTITGNNVTINQGEKFNISMLNLKAKDDNDGDLTKDIKIVKNNVDSKKPGTYNVIVKVTDSDGATTTKTFTVTVKKVVEKRSWTYMPELSKQTFNALNSFREKNGLKPLEYSEKSATRAKERAEYNAEHNTADHTASQIGLYTNDRNAQSFIASWAKSPLHKEDMLTTTYTGAGAGVYKDSNGRYFVVIDFYNDFWG